MAQVPQVLILGVVGFLVDLQRDVVRLCVLDLLFTAVQLPETPRSDDVHLRCKCVDGQLETNLIVALAGAAVADSIRALLEGNINDALCNDRAGERGTQQVLLVGGAGLHGRDDVVINEILGQILDVQLGSAGLESLLLQTVQLGALTDIAGNRDDLAAVMLLQPRNEYRSIQTAGVRENYLVIFLFHVFRPPHSAFFSMVLLYYRHSHLASRIYKYFMKCINIHAANFNPLNNACTFRRIVLL